MPEMDGIEILHAIREKEKNIPKKKGVKVIMVSSHKDRDSIIASVQTGCDDYITKPFEREIIIKKLDKLGLDYEKDETQRERPDGINTDSPDSTEKQTDQTLAAEGLC